jgi:hypothetical protein
MVQSRHPISGISIRPGIQPEPAPVPAPRSPGDDPGPARFVQLLRRLVRRHRGSHAPR